MKFNPLPRSGLTLLLVAGALTPLSSSGASSLYEDGAAYDNLRTIQSSLSMASSPQGAQGPVRTESMGPTWVFNSDGAAYDNLRTLQSASSMTSSQGAQGPVRTESMGPTWVFNSDGAAYDNLRTIQSSH